MDSSSILIQTYYCYCYFITTVFFFLIIIVAALLGKASDDTRSSPRRLSTGSSSATTNRRSHSDGFPLQHRDPTYECRRMQYVSSTELSRLLAPRSQLSIIIFWFLIWSDLSSCSLFWDVIQMAMQCNWVPHDTHCHTIMLLLLLCLFVSGRARGWMDNDSPSVCVRACLALGIIAYGPHDRFRSFVQF